MALYRETATGFIGEWATDPGVGFVAISAQPTDTINNKVAWWRNIDTFGQSSDWHPSLPGTPEYPGSDTRAGNGVNILPSDYASFEWAGSLPPMYLANAIANRSTSAKYHGTYGVRYAVTLAGGVAIFAKDSSTYNIPINPNGKWIISAYVRPVDNAVRSVSLQLTTTAGNTYTVTGNTLGNNASWVRISGVFNLTADASVAARLAISQGAAMVYVDIDALMLEEKVGPLDTPSTFNSPWGTGISTEQFPDYGIPQTKLYQDLGRRIDLIDAADSIPGSVNARLKSTSDTLNAAIGANGSAIIALQSSDATQATQISALGTRTGANETSITSINQTTAAQATAITALQAKDSSHDSSITNLNTVTASQATSISSLTTRTATAESNITSLQTTTSTQATSISNLSSTVDGHTASISTQATAISGLQAQYAVKLDVNGYVAGFGLWNNGAGDSGFLVRADKFAVGMPGNTNKIPFYVDASGTYIYDAFIKNLTADKITGGTIGAQTISMSGANSIIKSSNYSAGVSGWQIKGDGSAEFQNVTIRGTLNAADLKDGFLSIARLQDGSISNIKIGSVSADKITAGTIDAYNITVINLNATNISTGTLNGQRVGAGVDGSVLNDLSITNAKIANATITDAKISGTLSANRIAANSIDVGKLSFTPVTAGNAASDINNYATTIDGSKITTGTLNASKIVAGTITADRITVGGITTDRIGAQQITSMTGGFPPSWIYPSAGGTWTSSSAYISTNGGDLSITVSFNVYAYTPSYGITFHLYIDGIDVTFRTAMVGTQTMYVNGVAYNMYSGSGQQEVTLTYYFQNVGVSTREMHLYADAISGSLGFHFTWSSLNAKR